jgi:type I site-specific restriction-modification system R (restriction) subunit
LLPDLIAKNEVFHRLLTEGVQVNYTQDGKFFQAIVFQIKNFTLGQPQGIAPT